jgi:DNA-directed RNA polymerase subunit RPC12/RpoP
MAIKCGNCGGHFNNAELMHRRPPRYPWPLTPNGQRVLAENQARGGEHYQCPGCGQRTLIVS